MRELHCMKAHQLELIQQERNVLAKVKSEHQKMMKEKEEEMERRGLEIERKEDELKLREATITTLMVDAGVSEVQSQQTLHKSFENTFGSQKQK